MNSISSEDHTQNYSINKIIPHHYESFEHYDYTRSIRHITTVHHSKDQKEESNKNSKFIYLFSFFFINNIIYLDKIIYLYIYINNFFFFFFFIFFFL